MPERNHYEVIRLPRSASQEEIDAQYHELLYQYHPDRNQGDEERAVERTIALVQAYRALSDTTERRRYDFKITNPPIEEAQVKGLKLLKSKEKKEAEAKFSEGVAQMNLGEYVKAADCFKAAVKLESDFPEACYNLSLIGALLGNQNFALDALGRGLKSRPEDPNLLRLRKSLSGLFMPA
jgi:curved DNA-binding protein CbpA